MKFTFYLITFLFSFNLSFSQSYKVAILDFENTSGKSEYDALGKSLSNMLITDLKNNIHPKKVEFYERAQLNKILEEQKLQKGKNFDTKTVVDFGKLSGVSYVLVGAIFVLDGNCNISSKLVDVKTSKILITKEVNGKIESWLGLKSELAETIAKELNNPITLGNEYKTVNTTLSTLNQYAKILTTMDGGDAEKAEQLRSVFEETNPDFKYFKDIKEDIEKLTKRVSELENITNILTNNFELGAKAEIIGDYTNSIKYFESFVKNPGTDGYINNKILYAFYKISYSYFKNDEFSKALENSENAIKIYKYFPKANEVKLMALIKLSRNEEAIKQYDFIIDSLTDDNELAYRSIDNNYTINWSFLAWPYYGYGLKINDHTEEWCYTGINYAGYGNSLVNEVHLKKILSENKIESPINKSNKNILSQYEKLELKLMEVKDSEVFSSRNILNFYNLSLTYSDELYNDKDLKKYENHLVKEITRMESFGIPCLEGCGDSKRIYSEKYRSFLSDNGLHNSGQEFEESFYLIYGKFVLKYLNCLIEKNDIVAASKLYNSLTTEYVKDRKSYFYKDYWDMILGIREITNDFNTRQPLNMLVFQKKLNQLILKNGKITKEKLQCVIDFKITLNTESEQIAIDKSLSTDTMVWSTNLGITSLKNNFKIQFAKNESELYNCNLNSIPAYCFYDWNEDNGEKYGKLYNYSALKLISANLPSGWRIAAQNDFVKAFGLDDLLLKVNKSRGDKSTIDLSDLLSNYNNYYKDKILQKIKIQSGVCGGGGFSGIDFQQWCWTDDLSDSVYKKIVQIYEDRIELSGWNCPQCCMSIKLIKE